MVSKRNYIAVTVVMIVILVLFQLTGISENIVLKDEKNISADGVVSDEIEGVKKLQYEQTIKKLTSGEGVTEIGLVGKEELCLKVGEEWCINQKKTYRYYPSLQEAVIDAHGPKVLLADGNVLDQEGSSAAITKLGEQKRSIIFSGLPEIATLKKDSNLMKCLGIQEVRSDAMELDGFKLFEGFLLGGETLYDEYEQIIPYVKLEGSVQVYAVGQAKAKWFQELENEELPAIIWRNYNVDGNIYVVNSNFLEEKMGAGILTGFAADMESVYIYPVVNAQISALANYPMLSDENRSALEEEYGQDSIAIVRDVLWPGIAGVYYDTNEKMTALVAPRLDYSKDGKLDDTLLKYFYKQVTKMQGELGISGEQISKIPLEEKLGQDYAVLKKNLPNYDMRVFYAGDMKTETYTELLKDGAMLESVHTVLKDASDHVEDPLFSFTEGNALQMMLYMDSAEHENEDDFRFRCLQTAYGYSGSKLDLGKVMYPKSDEDLWNKVSEDWSRYYRPYRKRFAYFDKLTATAADQRVRNYLALDYEVEQKDESIVLNVETDENENYFIMKTHGEKVREIEGADYEELEEDWYLIQTKNPQITIRLEQTNKAEYE